MGKRQTCGHAERGPCTEGRKLAAGPACLAEAGLELLGLNLCPKIDQMGLSWCKTLVFVKSYMASKIEV